VNIPYAWILYGIYIDIFFGGGLHSEKKNNRNIKAEDLPEGKLMQTSSMDDAGFRGQG